MIGERVFLVDLTNMFFQVRLNLCLLCLFATAGASAQTALHINKATTEINFLDVVSVAFNSSDAFQTKNEIINAEVGVALEVTVTNNDTLQHSFTVAGWIESDNIIEPGTTESYTLTFDEPGSHRYYSDFAHGQLLGASGVIMVGYEDHPKYYWNLFDLESELTFDLSNGVEESIPTSYQPELFFINGQHFPNTLDDPDTYVTQQVGDEIIISIVNSGNMDHILHFHGYHVEIVQANIQSNRVGWSKDSIPVKRGEAMTVLLIPNQPGEFPVHDHNLITVTNAGFYPGGMITYLNITE